jgi:hypothetical protein
LGESTPSRRAEYGDFHDSSKEKPAFSGPFYRGGNQRFEMYIVISMPNRRSIAQGVSQVMTFSFIGESLPRGPHWPPAGIDRCAG